MKLQERHFLGLYDNGDLKLRLDDDFDTDAGPDVQIFLSNSNVAGTGVLIEDIGNEAGVNGGINHFSGTITFDTPVNTTISQYKYIGFHCVRYNVSWAIGEFGDEVSLITSLADTDVTASFQAFPNPATNQVQFSEELSNVSVYNLSGVLLESLNNANQIDVSTYENGIYFLNSDKGRIKMVVEH